jgi:polyhydroxyalkanoate synthesis repressor PhaR
VTPAGTLIKKYGNRRLYDTSASRYVNLEEIAAMVRNGTEIKVVDAKSGEDLTRLTLTQIIMEDAKDQPAGLPLEVLRQLIMASDHVRQEFLKSAFDAYKKVQNVFQGGLSEVQSAALSPLQMVRNFIQNAPAENPAASGDELRELRQRVAELEARLARPKRHPTNRRVAKGKQQERRGTK